MGTSLSTANVEGCKELAQTGCVSRWESFKEQVSWTCWPKGTCLRPRPGDVWGCLTNIGQFDGSTKRLWGLAHLPSVHGLSLDLEQVMKM